MQSDAKPTLHGSKKVMAKKKTTPKAAASQNDGRRSRVSQADLPRHSLREALTIAQALTDNFAGHATAPHQIAMSLDISPTSSAWRSLTGSAVAYGLTKGAYNSARIALEKLGRRATSPTVEADDIKARAEAALKPRIFSQFFSKYNRAKQPSDTIAKNVLQHDFGVPQQRLAEALAVLKDNGSFVGFIQETKTGPFISTEDLSPSPVRRHDDDTTGSRREHGEEPLGGSSESSETTSGHGEGGSFPAAPARPFQVFISHGRNMGIVDQVKDVLDLYDIAYEVAVEEESTAIPVPQKVLAAMRRCSAGIMIVSADDDDAVRAGTINNNVLIEIGAAFVLYDQKVVLLWDKRLKVPSNLQGLYRCEYEGKELTFAAGTKLSKAVKGFR